jgi:hypothetical protein
MQDTIAGSIMKFVHIPGSTSYGDVLSKPTTKSNEAFHNLVKSLLFFHVPKAGRGDSIPCKDKTESHS